MSDYAQNLLADWARALTVSRKKRDMTQQHMARLLDIGLKTYRRLEAGDPGVAVINYVRASLFLGYEVPLTKMTDPDTDHVGGMIQKPGPPK